MLLDAKADNNAISIPENRKPYFKSSSDTSRVQKILKQLHAHLSSRSTERFRRVACASPNSSQLCTGTRIHHSAAGQVAAISLFVFGAAASQVLVASRFRISHRLTIYITTSPFHLPLFALLPHFWISPPTLEDSHDSHSLPFFAIPCSTNNSP
jgi:hypothetical protein